MSTVDVVIVCFIVFGGFVGLKRGAVKEFFSAISLVAITVLAFLFKNPLSIIFYENLPFFKFGGIFKGVTVLNIALYELIAFLIVFLGLMLVWKLVSIATDIIQKIVNMTLILDFPSKLIGFVIGLLEYYIITFVALYILTLPMFNVIEINKSVVANIILNDTPIIRDTIKIDNSFVLEFTGLKDKYKNSDSATSFNYDTLDLFLKYDIIDVNSVKKLKEKNKLNINGLDNLIRKYEEIN